MNASSTPSPPPPHQDTSCLEGGGFYLDRKPRQKHLALAGTAYSREQVDELWARLTGILSNAVDGGRVAVVEAGAGG